MKKKILSKLLMGTTTMGVGITTAIVSTSCDSPSSLTLFYDQIEYTFNKSDDKRTTGVPILKDNKDQDVTATFAVTNGYLPYRFEIDKDTGEISGIPTVAFDEEITITATGTGNWAGLSISENLLIKVVVPNPSPSSNIIFGEYNPSMTVDESQPITATSSTGGAVTLGATGDEYENWEFEEGELSYTSSVDEKTTITITATDGISSNFIMIDLLPETPSPSPTSNITFDTYNPSMSFGDEPQLITATSSTGNTVSLSASGDNEGNWTFNEESGVLNYTTAVDEKTVITITAYDGIDYNNIKIDLLPEPPTPSNITFDSYSPSMEVGTDQIITATSSTGNTVSLSASGDNEGNWTFNEESGVLNYTTAVDEKTTITITATVDNDSNQIMIDLLASPTSLNLTYDQDSYSFDKDQYSSTDNPSIKDNLGFDVTATFTVTNGALPDGLSINHATGEIYGTSTIKSQQSITITATGKGLWNGLSCDTTLIINVVFNNIILTGNTMVDIINPDGLMVLNSDSSARLNSETYTSATISDVSLIKEIHITPDQTITTADDNYGAYLCYGMTNLTVGDVDLPQTIASVGTSFCESMFQESGITKLPDTFNLPQGITSVGNNFCKDMFRVEVDSELSGIISLPTCFNIPQQITTIGEYFCGYMFYGTSLVTLPPNFNLPTGITSAGHNFCSGLFSCCANLTSLPTGFNISPSITTIGNNFCDCMFDHDTALTSLPDGFNLPQGITQINDDFCTYMFWGCTSLASLPSSFNLPNGEQINSVGGGFCAYMFATCSSLTTLPANFNFNQYITTIGEYSSYECAFCEGMFKNCSQLGGLGVSGTRNLYVGGNATCFNYAEDMFFGCTILNANPANVPTTPDSDKLMSGYNIARNS